MNEVEYDMMIGELVFLDAWEGGLMPAVSGMNRVRQFLRANPGMVAEYRRLKARDGRKLRHQPSPAVV